MQPRLIRSSSLVFAFCTSSGDERLYIIRTEARYSGRYSAVAVEVGTAAAAVGVGMQVAFGRVAVEGSRPVEDNCLAMDMVGLRAAA